MRHEIISYISPVSTVCEIGFVSDGEFNSTLCSPNEVKYTEQIQQDKKDNYAVYAHSKMYVKRNTLIVDFISCNKQIYQMEALWLNMLILQYLTVYFKRLVDG